MMNAVEPDWLTYGIALWHELITTIVLWAIFSWLWRVFVSSTSLGKTDFFNDLYPPSAETTTKKKPWDLFYVIQDLIA